MIKVKKNTKVYVYCPGGAVTGGAELLHQLVHNLNQNGNEAFVVYFNSKKDFYDNENFEIPSDYLKYKIRVAKVIEDELDNIVVVYEGIFDKAFTIKKSKILLWWLSVDNFFYCSTNFLSYFDFIRWKPSFVANVLLRQVYYFFKRKDKYHFWKKTINDLKNLDTLNCYQSEYAQNFLINKGFLKTFPLSDYLNPEIVENYYSANDVPKKDIVLYNPKKGFKYTKKLMKLAPDINWVPLQGMTRNELIQCLKSSKVYIDFGYHPGKDRLPREAAICGCCIITNKEGSARFYEDVCIPNRYKFDKNESPKNVVKAIRTALRDYENQIQDYSLYRERIKDEERLFKEQVNQVFNND